LVSGECFGFQCPPLHQKPVFFLSRFFSPSNSPAVCLGFSSRFWFPLGGTFLCCGKTKKHFGRASPWRVCSLLRGGPLCSRVPDEVPLFSFVFRCQNPPQPRPILPRAIFFCVFFRSPLLHLQPRFLWVLCVSEPVSVFLSFRCRAPAFTPRFSFFFPQGVHPLQTPLKFFQWVLGFFQCSKHFFASSPLLRGGVVSGFQLGPFYWSPITKPPLGRTLLFGELPLFFFFLQGGAVPPGCVLSLGVGFPFVDFRFRLGGGFVLSKSEKRALLFPVSFWGPGSFCGFRKFFPHRFRLLVFAKKRLICLFFGQEPDFSLGFVSEPPFLVGLEAPFPL